MTLSVNDAIAQIEGFTGTAQQLKDLAKSLVDQLDATPPSGSTTLLYGVVDNAAEEFAKTRPSLAALTKTEVGMFLSSDELKEELTRDASIDADLDHPSCAVVCDKGYDSDANRTMARERRAVAVIQHPSNRKKISTRFAKALHQGRVLIE